MVYENDNTPTLLLISNSEIHGIFLRHKLFHKYHVHTLSPNSIKPSDLLKMEIDVIVIDDSQFSGEIFTFCSEIKKIRDLQFIPILIISGNLKKAYLEKLKKAGALNLLHEPLEEEELLLKLSDAKKYQEAHTKIDLVARYAKQMPPAEPLHNRSIFNKTDALRIQKEIIEKKSVTLIMIEFIPSDNTEKIRKCETMLKTKLRPKDLFIPLSGGKWILILSNISSKKGASFAKYLWSELSRISSLSVFIGTVSQDPEEGILFPSLKEMIRVARQCLSQAKSGNKELICYIQ